MSAIRRGIYRHVTIAAAAVLLTSAASLALHCERPTQGPATCVNGNAGPFTCRDVDLEYWFDLADIGGGAGDEGHAVWGWAAGGREFAIMSRTFGTSFVEVTDPQNPIYLGDLPTVVIPEGISDSDVEVYGNHAYIVRIATGHGVQIFDLTQLLSVGSPPVVFAATAHHPGLATRGQNIAINTDTGFAYVSNAAGCAGLEMLDLSNATNPLFVGCAGPIGQRDAQCVVYHGPDVAHVGDEICFKPGGEALAIVDVTDKNAPAVLGQLVNSRDIVSPQGWLTEDHSRFLVVDIHAARRLGTPRIFVFDVSDLEHPVIAHVYQSMLTSPDHNIYVEGNFAYEAQFDAGLRIFDIADVQAGELCEVASFDVCPGENTANEQGAFSIYPFLPSGNVLVGSTEGVAIVRPQLAAPTCTGPGPIRVKRTSLMPDRHFKFVAKGAFPLPANPADHPTNGGAQLVVTGLSGGTAAYQLPASCWKDLGPGDGSAGFKCKDTTCKVSIKPTGIKAVCRPDTGTLALPQSAISIQLKLGSGTTQYCALCGGQPKGSPDKPFFKRTDCLAIETCP
jgi:choice-of-anchor B domain-containing protein